MSTQSPQLKAANSQVSMASGLMNQLGHVAIPEYEMLLGNGSQPGMLSSMLSSAGNTGQLGIDRENLAGATNQLNSGYQQAGFGTAQNIGYGGLRSGEGRLSPGAMNAAQGNAATTLGQQYNSALNNLNFLSAQSSMTDYNKLLGLMGQGSQAALGMGQGYMGVANQALGGLKSTSELDDIMGVVGSVIGIAGSVYGAAK